MCVERIEPSLGIELIDDIGDTLPEAVFFDLARYLLRQKVLLLLIVSDVIRRHG